MATLQPRPGFDWLRVNWGGPDEPRSDRCSYCGDLFPEDDEADFIPLIMWNDAVLGRLPGLRVALGADVLVTEFRSLSVRPGRWLFVRFHRDGSAAGH